MSTLILLLIFITLKKNTKSAPISKHMTDRENYGITNDSDSKSGNKITDDKGHHHHHHHHHDRPSLKNLQSNKNLTVTRNPLLENFATQSRSSRFSEGIVDEIINNPFKSEEFQTEKYALSDTVTSDKTSRQFLNDLLILLFIGTVCLTFVVMSSWVFYNQARKFRKPSPDIEKQESETCVKCSETPMKSPEKPMKVSDTYSRISKILKKTNSEHDQHLLEELVDILRKNVEITSAKEETDDTQNDEAMLKSDLKEIERLTTVECSEEKVSSSETVSSSIPDLPHYLIERTKESTELTLPTVTQENVVTECKEVVSPKENVQLVYHAVMDNYRNDAITPTLHFIGKDVSTSTEDLDMEEGIEELFFGSKTEKEPDLDHPKKINRLKEESPKEDLQKTYFLNNEYKNDVSVQTVDPNDTSFVRRVKFNGEVTVKYYLVNQPIHAFDKRRKRNKTFEIREVFETFPTKRRDGLGKCKTLRRTVKSRFWVESKHSPRSIHRLCTCWHKD